MQNHTCLKKSDNRHVKRNEITRLKNTIKEDTLSIIHQEWGRDG